MPPAAALIPPNVTAVYFYGSDQNVYVKITSLSITSVAVARSRCGSMFGYTLPVAYPSDATHSTLLKVLSPGRSAYTDLTKAGSYLLRTFSNLAGDRQNGYLFRLRENLHGGLICHLPDPHKIQHIFLLDPSRENLYGFGGVFMGLT